MSCFTQVDFHSSMLIRICRDLAVEEADEALTGAEAVAVVAAVVDLLAAVHAQVPSHPQKERRFLSISSVSCLR